ncbi:PTS system mannose/fructose/N-acetylgalactosamine-transporter subunit IIB [Amphibacillus sp. Q70]|uniref:PTS system mannose/fructose/N-acetylgalactosamine-transporter subunit IIB n=1 Tax=Amphibacillus sp. Q70 TaxID=3453416 RepID=UPI003F833B18
MREVKLIRIDERLIHGQIVTTWTKASSCNTIVVADDKAANDPLSETLFKLALPRGVKLKVLKLDDVQNYLNQSGDEKILFIVGNLDSLSKLVDLGMDIKEVNVGNISQATGKKQYYKSIFLNESDLFLIDELLNKGIDLFVQVVPSDSKIPIQKLLNRK